MGIIDDALANIKGGIIRVKGEELEVEETDDEEDDEEEIQDEKKKPRAKKNQINDCSHPGKNRFLPAIPSGFFCRKCIIVNSKRELFDIIKLRKRLLPESIKTDLQEMLFSLKEKTGRVG